MTTAGFAIALFVTVQRSEANQSVIPAQAGIQKGYDRMDARFHGHDKNGRRELPEAERLPLFTVFFDQAVITRRGIIYRIPTLEKVVALTFDDGPSPIWTPKILDELKKAQVKATFFMIGEHVEKYPEVAKRVIQEGHEIENYTYDHHALSYYKNQELEKEILDAERAIKSVTGKSIKYFRPSKAWLTGREKGKD
ncbi:MAG: polysaccharide deacetylase family protein [Candidatus Omnitrophota bacterium]|nr:polysaccharide deacetylase family protein [Candidatus Omnitrophota bacterium]